MYLYVLTKEFSMKISKSVLSRVYPRKFSLYSWYNQKPLQTIEDCDNKVLHVISEKSIRELRLTKSMQFFSNETKTAMVVYYPQAQQVAICYTIYGHIKTKEFRLVDKLTSVDFCVNRLEIVDKSNNRYVEILE